MSKQLIKSLAIIGEAFQSINISDEHWIEASSSFAFLHLFDDIEDFRMQGKTKYKLSNLLLLILLVIIKEKTNSCFHIAAVIRVQKAYYTKLGLLEDGQCPSHDTLRRVLMMLDPSALQEITLHRLYDFLLDLEKESMTKDSVKHYAIDGKEARGTGRKGTTKNPCPNIALLNVYDSGLHTCLSSVPVHQKTNEIPVSQEVLSTMKLRKVMITADAIHCQRKTADIIHKKKGYYLLTVKENQELLLEEIQKKFKKGKSKIYHLERENRSIDVLQLPKNYAVDGFTGMKTFIKMKSTTRKQPSIRYYISNTIEEELIFDAIEARWSIENDLHKDKDMYLDEDNLRITNVNAVQNMAIINNFAIQMIRVYQSIANTDLYEAKLRFRLYPIECLNSFLEIMSCEEIVTQVKKTLRKVTK